MKVFGLGKMGMQLALVVLPDWPTTLKIDLTALIAYPRGRDRFVKSVRQPEDKSSVGQGRSLCVGSGCLRELSHKFCM